MKMKRIALTLALATLPSFLWISAAGHRAFPAAAAPSLAQTERMAVDLKQGMSAEAVRQLLGQPRRTSLKTASGSSGAGSQGTLQWTYSWTGSQGNLHVDFVAKEPDQWYVSNWEWSTY